METPTPENKSSCPASEEEEIVSWDNLGEGLRDLRELIYAFQEYFWGRWGLGGTHLLLKLRQLISCGLNVICRTISFHKKCYEHIGEPNQEQI